MDAFIDWIISTRLSWFITNYRWVWPINESLHFCGLTLLAGTVGLFDLRVLGFAKGIAPSTLHATLRVGHRRLRRVRGHGRAVHLRHAGAVLLQRRVQAEGRVSGADGRNAALFYWREFAGVRALGPHDDAPRSTKIVAAASLVFLVGVMLCGRMLTFFRPPYD